MKPYSTSIRALWFLARLGGISGLLLFAGCSVGSLTGLGSYSQAATGIGTSLGVLNYTDKGYDWVGVANPADPERSTASDMGIRPYGGGGVVCCYPLPPRWRPGLKVVVKTKLDSEAKTYEERKYEVIPVLSKLVDIPPYPDGQAGILWLQIMGPQDIRVTASNLDPAHPDWPGEVRGGPRPSLEYRRKMWDEEMKLLIKDLADFEAEIKTQNTDKHKYRQAIDSVRAQIKLLGPRP